MHVLTNKKASNGLQCFKLEQLDVGGKKLQLNY